MSEDNKKEYAGVSKTAAALGQSQVDGLVATVGGAAVGAAAGAVLHSKEKHAVQTLEQLEKTGGVGAFVKGAWNNSMGRGSKAMVGAIAVGLAAGTVGNLVGLFRGAKKAGGARKAPRK